MRTDHKAPCYVVYSTPTSPRPSWAQITSSASYSSDSVPHLEFDIYVHQERIHLKLGAMIFMGLNLYDAYTTNELGTALTVLNQNIRDLFNKYSGLICSLKTNQISPHLVYLMEHYLSKQILSLIKLENYSLGSSDSCILNQVAVFVFTLMFLKTV